MRKALAAAWAGALAITCLIAPPAQADPEPAPSPAPPAEQNTGKDAEGKAAAVPERPDDAGYYRHQNRPRYKVLVFVKGADPAVARAGVEAVRRLGREHRFAVDASADGTPFTAEKLAAYRAVIFLGTTGDVLNDEQQAAFETYFTAGGGYAGLASAAATETSWPFYAQVLGTTAGAAGTAQPATVKVADRVHPSTAKLPERWKLSERWYDFAANVRGTAHVLATVDETTYTGGGMGADHPISWCRDFRGGRSWYSGLGLSAGTYGDATFRRHLLGGIEWAAGSANGDCGATVLANYEKVTLNDEPGEPMTMAVLPDGRVLHNSRNGQIRLYDPATNLSPVINTVPVYNHDEDGLQSVAIDPDFAENRWVYFYYAPPLNTPVDDPATPGVNEGDAPIDSDDPTAWDAFKGYNQLSRAKLVEEPTPHLDMSTEQQILRVDTNRGTCCHVGGEIRFDGDGLLYIATGDDTNAGGSDGYTPIFEAPTRNPAYDAQRSAANTNDLRGKMLRIRMKADGSYSIPRGNLFRPGTEKTRPEIYLMGLRNPFRYDVGRDGTLYIADYSPDARTGTHLRGPAGTGKWFTAKKAGNWGWPYCATRELPYTDYDFATQTSGQPFDCAGGPVNESPRNTGLAKLPPVEQPEIWYSYTEETPCAASIANPPGPCPPLFPELGTGGVGPMGGDLYEYDKRSNSAVKFPAYYDNSVVFGEFTRDYLKEFKLDSKGAPLKINPLLNEFVWDNPMDMEFGPDGALYVLEYGDGFFRANPEAQLSVVRYVKGTRAPTARMTATPSSGPAPLTVAFSSEGSADADPGESISFAWDFTGDGTVDSVDPQATHTYTENGVYTATLTVTDSSGRTDVENRTITVGNTAPTVTIDTPAHGGFFSWGDTVPWTVTVRDPEDGGIDCTRVRVAFVLGHDTHGHEMSSTTGCSGTFQTPADGADHAGGYLFGGITAEYTDTGDPALTGGAENVIQLRRQEAEFAQARQGVEITVTGDAGGGLHQTSVDPGDWIAFDPVNLVNIDTVTFRVAGAGTAGQPRAAVELRLDAPDGPLVTTATINGTGGANTWQSQTAPIADPGGTHRLYLVFRSVPGGPTAGLFNLNWAEFGGQGVTRQP